MLQSLQGSWSGWIWRFLYFGGGVKLGHSGPEVAVTYSIVPWIGVMAAGYAFGAVMVREPAERNRMCVTIGGAAIVLFLLASRPSTSMATQRRTGIPRRCALARAPPSSDSLNTNKYPASLLFLLMTLGLTIAPVAAGGARTRKGRRDDHIVWPSAAFYYPLHIPLIHATWRWWFRSCAREV